MEAPFLDITESNQNTADFERKKHVPITSKDIQVANDFTQLPQRIPRPTIDNASSPATSTSTSTPHVLTPVDAVGTYFNELNMNKEGNTSERHNVNLRFDLNEEPPTTCQCHNHPMTPAACNSPREHNEVTYTPNVAKPQESSQTNLHRLSHSQFPKNEPSTHWILH